MTAERRRPSMHRAVGRPPDGRGSTPMTPSWTGGSPPKEKDCQSILYASNTNQCECRAQQELQTAEKSHVNSNGRTSDGRSADRTRGQKPRKEKPREEKQKESHNQYLYYPYEHRNIQRTQGLEPRTEHADVRCDCRRPKHSRLTEGTGHEDETCDRVESTHILSFAGVEPPYQS